MFLTKAQYDKLIECPMEEVTLDGREGWNLAGQDDEGRLELKFHSFSLGRGYERFLTTDGVIEMFDADRDAFVREHDGRPVTFEPFQGSYATRIGRGGVRLSHEQTVTYSY